MKKCMPLTIAGMIFTVFGCVHALRLFYHWDIVIDGVSIPMYASTIAVIVSAILALWMFAAACCKK